MQHHRVAFAHAQQRIQRAAAVAVGDEVFGLGSATCAELAVLDVVAAKPPSLSFEAAAALPVAVETAKSTETFEGALGNLQASVVSVGAGILEKLRAMTEDGGTELPTH